VENRLKTTRAGVERTGYEPDPLIRQEKTGNIGKMWKKRSKSGFSGAGSKISRVLKPA
jgi:hypothetical protein